MGVVTHAIKLLNTLGNDRLLVLISLLPEQFEKKDSEKLNYGMIPHNLQHLLLLRTWCSTTVQSMYIRQHLFILDEHHLGMSSESWQKVLYDKNKTRTDDVMVEDDFLQNDFLKSLQMLLWFGKALTLLRFRKFSESEQWSFQKYFLNYYYMINSQTIDIDQRYENLECLSVFR